MLAMMASVQEFATGNGIGLALLITAGVGLLHNLAVSGWAVRRGGIAGALGNRDDLPTETGWAARARRARSNFVENVLLFLTVVLAVVVTGARGPANIELGAMIFAVSRALYLPIYLIGVPVLRTLLWLASIGGIALMVVGVLQAL